MPALQGAESRDDAMGSVVAPGGVGVYLTNETFLYRVVGVVASDAGELVELEDCYGLDVVRIPATALRARRLRVVMPSAEG